MRCSWRRRPDLVGCPKLILDSACYILLAERVRCAHWHHVHPCIVPERSARCHVLRTAASRAHGAMHWKCMRSVMQADFRPVAPRCRADHACWSPCVVVMPNSPCAVVLFRPDSSGASAASDVAHATHLTHMRLRCPPCQHRGLGLHHSLHVMPYTWRDHQLPGSPQLRRSST